MITAFSIFLGPCLFKTLPAEYESLKFHYILGIVFFILVLLVSVTVSY